MHGRPPSLDRVLPHGFRFNPYDRELLDYYRAWVRGEQLPCDDIIVGAEVYSTEPWNLVNDSEEEEDEEVGYFFSYRTFQHRRSTYMCRRAGSGAWYPEKKYPIKVKGKVIGHKQMLCYYLFQEDTVGSTRKRKKIKKSTGWVMYEYELPPSSTNIPRQQREPILCLIRKTAQAISSSRKKYRETVETANTTLPVNTAIQTSNFSYHWEVSDTKPIPGIAPSSSFVVREEYNTGCSMSATSTADNTKPISVYSLSTSSTLEEANTIYEYDMPVEPLPLISMSDIDCINFGNPACPSSAPTAWKSCNTRYSMPSMPSTSMMETNAANLQNIPYHSSSFVVQEDCNMECSMSATSTADNTNAVDLGNLACPFAATPYYNGLEVAELEELFNSTLWNEEGNNDPPDVDVGAAKSNNPDNTGDGSSWNPTNSEAEKLNNANPSSSGGGDDPRMIDPFEWYTKYDPTDW